MVDESYRATKVLISCRAPTLKRPTPALPPTPTLPLKETSAKCMRSLFSPRVEGRRWRPPCAERKKDWAPDEGQPRVLDYVLGTYRDWRCPSPAPLLFCAPRKERGTLSPAKRQGRGEIGRRRSLRRGLLGERTGLLWQPAHLVRCAPATSAPAHAGARRLAGPRRRRRVWAVEPTACVPVTAISRPSRVRHDPARSRSRPISW
jgi:hypothetical protein